MPRLTREQRKHIATTVNRVEVIRKQYMSSVCDTLPDFATDLLADLMHWCKARKIDFDNQLRIAGDHYRCEKAGIE